jgi:hypothetical protein
MKQMAFSLLWVLLFTATSAFSQVSDYDVKTNYETQNKAIKTAIDASTSVRELDSLKLEIDSLESAYMSRKEFLDKALYPDTFTESISNLRAHHFRTYDWVRMITEQGGKIVNLEQRIVILTSRLDSLTIQRNQLFAELQDTKRSLSALRETVKKLQANMQAKDRLLFALIDSIFLPYDKNLNQLGDVQRDAVGQKLLKANILTRLYDIAADNVKFLDVTQLQPKDYAGLIDQCQQFQTKWTGLRQKINAVYETGVTQAGAPGTGKASKAPSRPPAVHVDSALYDWTARLVSNFWSALAKEFAGKNIAVKPFTDSKSFSASMRQYVDSMKTGGHDASVFVEELWKKRIDKEWREALTKESMLGKTEYASLDKAVSELSQSRINFKVILYIAVALALVFFGWRFLRRKSEADAPA